jgi:heme exporter protein A
MTLASAQRGTIGMAAMSVTEALPPPTLSIEGLAIRRGERTLFEGVGLSATPGSVILVRGPNGAGKSSLLLAIAGVLHPSAGTIRYGNDQELAPNLHFVGHQTGVKTRLTLSENLRFWASVFGGNGVTATAALEAVGLGGKGELDAGYLSAGQTRRLALARLMVSRRSVWLLDEPTAALDADGDGMVERLISEHAQGGGIVIVATHHDLDVSTRGDVLTLALGAA